MTHKIFSSKTVRSIGALALMFALLGGCAERTVAFDLRVITEACDGTSPIEGASHFAFRVSGEGLTVREKVVTIGSGEVALPEIPPGRARVVEVRAYSSPPTSGGDVLAVGRSLPFDVPESVPSGDAVRETTVFLRRVDAFTRPNAADAPGQCLTLGEARAGHTATLLPDGRVLIAGGYRLNAERLRTSLSSAEFFNPVTGVFEAAPELRSAAPDSESAPRPRAFHSATLLDNGQVFIAGGEEATPSRWNASNVGLLFDPSAGRYAYVQMAGSARFRHQAVKDAAGRVVVVGGVSYEGASSQQPPERTVGSVEWFDPSFVPAPNPTTGVVSLSTFASSIDLPREGMNVAAFQEGRVVAVAGGTKPGGTGLDGGELRSLAGDVSFLTFGNSTYALTNQVPLSEPRRQAMLIRYRETGRLLLAGGFNGARDNDGNVNALNSSEILLATDAGYSAERGATVITPRADACSVLLADERIWLAGGRSLAFSNEPINSNDTVELIDPFGAATPLGRPRLPEARWQHTCTLLADGSVLVLGGRKDTAGQSTVLNDARIFMPKPVD